MGTKLDDHLMDPTWLKVCLHVDVHQRYQAITSNSTTVGTVIQLKTLYDLWIFIHYVNYVTLESISVTTLKRCALPSYMYLSVWWTVMSRTEVRNYQTNAITTPRNYSKSGTGGCGCSYSPSFRIGGVVHPQGHQGYVSFSSTGIGEFRTSPGS